MEHFEEFFNAYLTCALWSSTDESDESGGEPLDRNYSVEDFDDDSLQSLRVTAEFWFRRNWPYIKALELQGVTTSNEWNLYEQAGHDLWLTQNGHGSGFWDRDFWGCYKELFDKRAKAIGEINITVGNIDKKLYMDF